ncbi:uncharacterized protein FPRO_14954 [Fusarium proliferatum ET1]|uniref:Carrier domain-containing protein n=1 Tax=Fusarium proliferatum (strain ET1) TaxID=1227346 RepID=A0A1L7VZM1_FUSPR|nr:uncharacterized protein FPRO_14954 [Fusarium proliferatum ET1]CZR45870.1 uncharacterized protein FPRO_14954 [Fusarium proliferatum ET1]
MAIEMIDGKVLACNLDAFAGRDTDSTDINEQAIERPSAVPSAVTLEAAWSVTLRLYTGLDHVSFGSLAQDGTVATRICNFRAHDTLEDIHANVRLCDYSDDTVCHYNTAVIYKLDENGGNKVSELIPRRIVVNVIGVPYHEVVSELPDIDTTSLNFDIPAIRLFTSGSTGTPKGIIGILQFASYTLDVYMVDVFTELLHGGTLCITSEEERMAGPQEYISRTQPNWAALSPTVARFLDPTLSARSIRKLLLVGEMVRESDIAEWTDPGHQGRASSVGTGINTHTWVVDVKNKRLVPIGAVGELICTGPHLIPGYLNDPERTTSSFFENPGWIPDMIEKKPFSRRFYRSVISFVTALMVCYITLGAWTPKSCLSHNAAVLVPEAGPIKNKLTAVLEGAGSPGQPPAVSPCDPGVAPHVQQALRDNLPSYMCPPTWISVKHLPLSSSGKLDRRVLTNKLETLCHEEYLGLILDHAQDEDDQHGHEDDNCRRILREGCIQVLNIPVERIAISKAFAAHGGDSITAIHVSSLMKWTQTLLVSFKELLTCPSLAEAASGMREAVTSIQVPAAHPGKLYPLSPIQLLFLEIAPTSVTWNHCNQSVLLRLRERRSSDHVKETLGGVCI